MAINPEYWDKYGIMGGGGKGGGIANQIGGGGPGGGLGQVSGMPTPGMGQGGGLGQRHVFSPPAIPSAPGSNTATEPNDGPTGTTPTTGIPGLTAGATGGPFNIFGGNSAYDWFQQAIQGTPWANSGFANMGNDEFARLYDRYTAAGGAPPTGTLSQNDLTGFIRALMGMTGGGGGQGGGLTNAGMGPGALSPSTTGNSLGGLSPQAGFQQGLGWGLADLIGALVGGGLGSGGGGLGTPGFGSGGSSTSDF